MTRRISILILSLLPFLMSAAELPMEMVPWSATCYYGQGERMPLEPAVNSALLGTPIRINGMVYSRGIGSWIGGSMVYQLNGLAEKFQAMIGIDDSSSSDDKGQRQAAQMLIIVDRQVVVDKEIHAGELLPVSLDLRKKHLLQIWFRGVRGAPGGFIGIVKASFSTGSPDALMTQLKNAAAEYQKNISACPQYPPAPKWEKLRIEKIAWQEFSNAYRISNGKIELIVVPEFGGRIMAFSAYGKQNYLLRNLPYNRNHQLKQACSGDFAGGHFMRFLPVHSWLPLDVMLDHGPYSIDFPQEGKVIMRSLPSTWFQLRYEYEITVDPLKPECQVIDRIVNTAPYPQTLSIWSITRMPGDVMTHLILPPTDKNRPESFTNKEGLHQYYSTGKNFIFKYGAESSGEKDVSEICYFPLNNEINIQIHQKDRPALHIQYDSRYAFPDNDYFPLHFYIAKFSEVESHGAKKTLSPGESIKFPAVWSVPQDSTGPNPLRQQKQTSTGRF